MTIIVQLEWNSMDHVPHDYRIMRIRNRSCTVKSAKQPRLANLNSSSTTTRLTNMSSDYDQSYVRSGHYCKETPPLSDIVDHQKRTSRAL